MLLGVEALGELWGRLVVDLDGGEVDPEGRRGELLVGDGDSAGDGIRPADDVAALAEEVLAHPEAGDRSRANVPSAQGRDPALVDRLDEVGALNAPCATLRSRIRLRTLDRGATRCRDSGRLLRMRALP
jgi:hypothetical protein